MVRAAAAVDLHPLRSPSYRIGELGLPARMATGTTLTLDVLVQNKGSETWPAIGDLRDGSYVHLAYLWFNERNEVVQEGGRTAFPESIQPGDVTKVRMTLRAPTVPGKYRLVVSPVQESVLWFSRDAASGKAIEIF